MKKALKIILQIAFPPTVVVMLVMVGPVLSCLSGADPSGPPVDDLQEWGEGEKWADRVDETHLCSIDRTSCIKRKGYALVEYGVRRAGNFIEEFGWSSLDLDANENQEEFDGC
ncbi:hypothetical protein Q669_29660 [Labrenzia sp. C1B10]|uniref:hypothetical protein n=1 Tax=unclassified Labrenzia TaxID=2648686 RepID=UPI0003B7F75C|nr:MULTISPECIES: hypothetical protein [unclassified Labrenzia]ERP95738.1 hypothetical protein Q669_29660 [Labrenzia sp. C1B10]ERS05804.1 hypothetical protein Q675_29225 [Labrenzia sp. C1B70]